MTRTLFLLLSFTLLAALNGAELEGTYQPASAICPSPEEARAKMTVPEGYEVRCFAHEPMLQNPVAMTWDARGRLWVVEAYEYPNGSQHPAPFGGEVTDDQYHPLPVTKGDVPRDRVIILEDTDNNGEADKRTVFVEGLNLASAILCGDDGIYVGQQPHLIHFRDANHDDKPDEWRVVLTGFGREDTHELVNSFCWGPDGWLYMTHGVFTNSKVRRPGQPESEGFKFDAGIGRCRPTSVGQAFQPATPLPAGLQAGKPASPWEFEVFADGTSNPWGCDYDAAGNFFVSACVIDHFFHMAPGGIYVRQGGAPENPYAYEQLPSIVKHKHFRAAYAGIQIYQGGVYPKDTWGHAFIGNIHDNAIHEEVITPVGATFKCEPRRDFLRANDGWFRPVSTQTGPDGNLWIMDWCDKYPCYQNAKANPEGVDRKYGRIWRVVSIDKATLEAEKEFEGFINTSSPIIYPTRASNDLDLAKLPAAELVKLLEHPNNWMRRMARRKMVETNAEQGREGLETLVKTSNDKGTQVEALWTLWGVRALGERFLNELEHHPTTSIRHWVYRLLHEKVTRSYDNRSKFEIEDRKQMAKENEARSNDPNAVWPHPNSPDAITARLAMDKEPFVRLGAAIALRQYNAGALTTNRFLHYEEPVTDCFPSAVPEALIRGSIGYDDPLLNFMIWEALEPHVARSSVWLVEKLAEYCIINATFGRTLSHKTMRRLCDTRKQEDLDLALDFLGKIKAHDALLAHALSGLVKGQEGGVLKPTRPFSALLAEFTGSQNPEVRMQSQTLATLWGDAAAIERQAALMTEPKTPEAERIAALQTLRKVRNEATQKAYASIVARVCDPGDVGRNPPAKAHAFALEVIRAATELGDDTFPATVTARWQNLSPPLQLAALDALASRPTWTMAMLDAVQAKQIPSTGFPASVRRQLATSKEKAIRDLSHRLLGAWKESSEDTKAMIAAKRKACLEGTPDLAAGKLLFAGTCAVCHVFHGGGQKVGPDLIGSGRSNLDALLTNVIDPNQIIGNGYENIVVSTNDNRTLMGRITEDTPSHVKLLAIGGSEQTIARDQIAKLENTKQSLMPMGFGALPDDQFRNLIWYILSPPEEGPLTPEKKKMLSTSIDDRPTKKTGTNWRAIDWESVSLWNPEWKVSAPDFERTPLKLAEYHGRTNVLLMHPFPDKKTPATLEFKGIAKSKLKFSVAADDRGDWLLKVVINWKPIQETSIDHEKPRWKEFTLDTSAHAGKEITVRLEAHPSQWAWEFSYWHQIRWE